MYYDSSEREDEVLLSSIRHSESRSSTSYQQEPQQTPLGFSTTIHPYEETFSVPIGTGNYKTHSMDKSFSRKSYKSMRGEGNYSKWYVDYMIFKNALRRAASFFFTPIKMRFLFVMCLIGFCIFLFVNTPMEKEPQSIAFSKEDPYHYELTGKLKVLQVEVRPQEPEENWNNPQVFVYLEGEVEEKWEIVSNWTFDLLEKTESKYFDVYDKKGYSSFRLEITTDVEESLIGAQFRVMKLSKTVKYETVFAGLILIFAYGLIVTEIIDRSLAAMVGALIALCAYAFLHEAPSFEKIVSWIDYETTGLLFGMMIMVGVFSETGFFEWSAVKAYKLARGDGTKKDSQVLMNLVLILCIFTAVVSAFLDNVTTILLLSKVTIRLCEVLGVDPVPVLISEVLFSNIGGTATPIGDPPNIIIVNNDDVAEEVNFGNFFLHVCPGIVLSGFVCCYAIKRMLQPHLRQRGAPSTLQHEIQIWESTLARLKNDTEEERQVRKQLRQHIQQLLSTQETNTAAPDISELEKKYIIHDETLLSISALVLGFVILCFFLRSAFESSLTPAIIAIVGALTLLLAAGVHKMEEVLKNVEWETLIFFSCLFVLMECLSELGLVELVGDITASLIEKVPAGDSRLAVAIVLIVWVSAIVSAFIDNIPYTAAMVPVIVQVSEDDDLPLSPLVWALVYGSCLGGNGTLTGASANVVCAGIAGTNGHPISFIRFTMMGVPITLICLCVVTFYLLIFHVVIPWY